jgi:superfamily II DNA helicase RecQ
MLQIKIYTIPLLGGDWAVEEMNTFLRGQKILQVESQQVNDGSNSYWSFCIRYLSDYVGRMPSSPFGHSGQKIDHQAKLDPKSAARFGQYRTIRRDLSKKEGIPAYAIFTDEQLGQLAQIEDLTLSQMKAIKGIGEKTIEKFGNYFLNQTADETSQ